MRSLGVACLALLLSAGCGTEDNPPPRPDVPAQNDAAFALHDARRWYLIGNELTPGHDHLTLRVSTPTSVERVWVWLDDASEPIELTTSIEGFLLDLDLAGVPAGEHALLFSADRQKVGFARLVFQRSHPLYVIVSVDWDGADTADIRLQRHVELHEWHPELQITHFVGPYTFTNPSMTEERIALIVDWLKMMRDDWGDEIGLHIHPYCNFVDTTEVTCRHEPSTVDPAGDASGYTVVVASYTESEFETLLRAADALFEAHGLGKPTSFRAGGWTARLNTLRSLAATGYVVDTSANNWARMEEWKDRDETTLYEWNMETWSSIGDTSQPYYPSDADLLSSDEPVIPILEVPDNGILVDYVTAAEMIEIFDANFDGSALAQPTMYQIGFHSDNFYPMFQDNIDQALTHVDGHLSTMDQGPVVYANISDLVKVWPVPE